MKNETQTFKKKALIVCLSNNLDKQNKNKVNIQTIK